MTRFSLVAAFCLFACSEKKSSPAVAGLEARRAANEQVLLAAKGPRALRSGDRQAIQSFLANAGTRESLIEALAASCHARVAAQVPVREALEQSAASSQSCTQAECAVPLEALYDSTEMLKEALRSLERDTGEPCAADFAQNFDAYIERIRAHRRR